MRTEDDLRAAFSDLARDAPDPGTVLRAVYQESRAAGRTGSPRTTPPRRLLRQRPLHVAMAAVGAALAAAALTVSLAGQRSGHSPGPVTLRARMLAAIDASRGDILYASTPGGRGGTWVTPWYPRRGQQVRVRVLGLDSHGVPFKDAEYTFPMPAGRASAFDSPIDWGLVNASGMVLVVDHQKHTWGEWHHASITLGLPVNPAGIRSEITHGYLHVVARTTLSGHPAIELGMNLTRGNSGPVRVITARLWVSATSYLPMRTLLKFSTGAQALTDYTFLPPTPANLAKLRPVIPVGYQRTYLHPGQMGKRTK